MKSRVVVMTVSTFDIPGPNTAPYVADPKRPRNTAKMRYSGARAVGAWVERCLFVGAPYK